MHAHTDEHDDGAGLIEALGGQQVEYRQDEHQGDARQLPEKFRHTPVHFPEPDDLRQEIVQHALVKAVGQSRDQHRQQKHLEAGAFNKSFLQGFESFHSLFPPKERFVHSV